MAVAACGGPAPAERTRAATPPTVRTAAPTLGRWEHADAASGFRPVARVRSQHLGTGAIEAEVLANDVAAAYPELGPARQLPPGSVLLERLHPAGSGEAMAWFAMVRPLRDGSAGPWQFLVVRPDGELLARDPPGCARCHAEAPYDGVFGPPRPTPDR